MFFFLVENRPSLTPVEFYINLFFEPFPHGANFFLKIQVAISVIQNTSFELTSCLWCIFPLISIIILFKERINDSPENELLKFFNIGRDIAILVGRKIFRKIL